MTVHAKPRTAIPKQDCIQCGDHFTPTRSDAKYCSANCRVKAHRAANAQNIDVNLINENIDAHGRAYRLWCGITESRGDLVDIKFTSTFSGALKPEAHRTLWQATLPRDAIATLHTLLGEHI
jgi:hypothetical protein